MPVGADGKEVKDTFDPVKFREEFKTEILGDLNNTVNGAVKGLKTDFQKILDEFKKTIPEQKQPNSEVEEKTGEPKTIAELNAKLAGYEKTVKDITAQLETEKTGKAEADKRAKEAKRVSSFDTAISDLQFATPKAKQQFRDAYLGKVEYGEDGEALIIKVGDKPMDMAGFIANEYNESTHLQPPQGRGGAGASAGRVVNTSGFNFDPNMTPAQVNALPAEQKQAYRDQLSSAIQAGGH